MSATASLHFDEKGYGEISVTAREHRNEVNELLNFCTLTIEAARTGQPNDTATLFLTKQQLDHILHECSKLYEERLAAREEVDTLENSIEMERAE